MIKTILVVDDDFFNLKIAEDMLSDEYKVITAQSGEIALQYLRKEKIDLVLLDVIMPRMSGKEVMRIIREDEELFKIPVIFLTSDRSVETEVECFKSGAVDFIGKPFAVEVIKTRIKRILELEGYKKNLENIVDDQTKEIIDMQQEALNIQEEVVNIQQEVIIGMANLIESRDGNTGEHVKRTNFYVNAIVQRLKEKKKYMDILTDEYITNLVKAAAMHDIGKITTPDDILQKPGRLTVEEFEVMKKHSMEGGRIIRNTMDKIENKEYIDIAYDVAVYHHEKWDGGGYPYGLSGDEIPLAARIMAVADVFDALISERCYKKAIPLNDAFQIIKDSSGTHFDAVIVETFLELRPKIEEMIKNEDV